MGDASSGGPPWESRTHPVREDMAMQRRTWAAERIAWVLMGAIMVATLFGLFGNGVVSSRTVQDAPGTLEASYSAFGRLGASTRLHLVLAPQGGDEVAIVFGETLLRHFTIEAIHPRPTGETAADGRLRLTFAAAPGEATAVALDLRPHRVGPVETEIGYPGASPLRLSQLFFP